MSAIDCSRLHSIQVPVSDIGAHFGMLLENMEGSDITFDVAGEKFRSHKLVLAARSPVFRTEIFDGVDEQKKEMVITDLEPRVFKVRNLLHLSFWHSSKGIIWFLFLRLYILVIIIFFVVAVSNRPCCTLFTETLFRKMRRVLSLVLLLCHQYPKH